MRRLEGTIGNSLVAYSTSRAVLRGGGKGNVTFLPGRGSQRCKAESCGTLKTEKREQREYTARLNIPGVLSTQPGTPI